MVVMVLQFILTLQTNIRAKINAIVNVNIDKVALGSILVTNTATFTDANSDTATAGQRALAKVLDSGDLTGIFGTQYGDVTVSNITTPYAGNPSRSNACWLPLCVLVLAAISISISASCRGVLHHLPWQHLTLCFVCAALSGAARASITTWALSAVLVAVVSAVIL